MPPQGAPCHAVYFYRDLNELSRTVTDFLADGLRLDEPSLLLARPEVCEAIERTLAGMGVDVEAEERNGRLIVADAVATLESILNGGRLDVDRAFAIVDGLFNRLAPATNSGRIRLYGEMAGMLWRSGRYVEALELEDLRSIWDTRGGVMTLCGYSTLDRAERSSHDAICTFHSHLLSDAGQLEPIPH